MKTVLITLEYGSSTITYFMYKQFIANSLIVSDRLSIYKQSCAKPERAEQYIILVYMKYAISKQKIQWKCLQTCYGCCFCRYYYIQMRSAAVISATTKQR